MRRVRIVESLKYGGRMFAYLLSVVVLGSGGIVLGVAVGWNSVTIRGTGGDPVVYSTPELLGGAVLVLLGGAVLFTGLLGFTHKLIADSTAVGVAAANGPGTVDVFDSVNAGGDAAVGDGSARSASAPAENSGAQATATAGGTAGGTAAGAGGDAVGETEPSAQPGAEPEPTGGDTAEPAETPARNARQTGTPGAESEPEEPARDDEPDDAEKERTAEQIAFGVESEDDSETDSSTGGDDGSAVPDTTGPEGKTPAETTEPEQSDLDDQSEEPAIFTEDRAAMAEDASSEEAGDDAAALDADTEEADEGTAMEDDAAGGGEQSEDKETVVPEYDEISTEEPTDDTSDSDSEDPLGNSFK